MYLSEKVKEIGLNILKVLDDLKDDNCLKYPTTTVEGYGEYQQKIDNKQYHFRMHRVMYQMYYKEELLEQDVICHKCDNPCCCNPKHLFKGTHKDNSDDKLAKGRQAKGKTNGRYTHGYNSKFDPVTKPVKSFEHKYNRLLTEEEVKTIKIAIRDKGKVPLRILAEKFNISYVNIRAISSGKAYKDVNITL